MKRVYDDNAKPIEEELAELAKKIPIEEWRKLPKDGSKNLDHYIYGSKKQYDGAFKWVKAALGTISQLARPNRPL